MQLLDVMLSDKVGVYSLITVGVTFAIIVGLIGFFFYSSGKKKDN
ncbi:MAG: hypothetical protein RIS84_148 [Pseudomonadota bacterium]|jgi:hypothetical protein|nr:DUF3149 domain-containing protein [Thiotrichaceae bacterium]